MNGAEVLKPSDAPHPIRMKHLHDDGFGPFVVVEGNIGSGKSSFCNLLAAHRRQIKKETVELFLEPVDQPRFRRLLGCYYGNDETQQGPEWNLEKPERMAKAMSRWGFALQIHALTERHAQHRCAVELVSMGRTVIQDRSIFADGCFGIVVREDGNMTDDEWGIYCDLFGRMKRDLRYPDVMIYLRTDPKECFDRMERRRRPQEDGVPLDYLKRIHDKHEMMIEEMARYTRVIRLDWNFMGGDMGQISDFIDETLKETRVFLKDFRRL